jgi:hypothetical protein
MARGIGEPRAKMQRCSTAHDITTMIASAA